MRLAKFVIRLSPDERAVAHTQALGLRRHLFNKDGKHSQVTLFSLPESNRVALRHVRSCLHVLAFPALSRTLTACQAAADADHHRNLASYVCLSFEEPTAEDTAADVASQLLNSRSSLEMPVSMSQTLLAEWPVIWPASS